MKNNYPYLKDINFLKTLTSMPVLQYYTKIKVLTWSEDVIEQIQGRVSQASFSIDGNSSIRRTGNITLILNQDENFSDIKNLFSINKKISVEIGFKNTTNKYNEFQILWFPLGIYVIWDPAISHNVTDLTISLQLKDKMCLLNGDCGGTLPASTVFDNYETIDQDGNQVINRPTIYQIIRQLVNHFGGEQLGKIIISDLDTRVKQVMKWTGSTPLYFLQKTVNNIIQYYVTIDENDYNQKLQNGYLSIEGSPFEYGNDVGYIYTDFTYPGDLIGDAGNTVVDILQKIKQTLGNYEYFYDLQGNFVFQQIKNYLNNTQTKYILDSLNAGKFVPDYISSLYTSGDAYTIDTSTGKSVFSFNDSNLITSYTNNPLYSMIKNDFIVWGLKENNNEQKQYIRYHLAIDKKPKIGNTYQAFKYLDTNDGIEKWHTPIKYNSIDDFPSQGNSGIFYMDLSQNKIYKWGIVEVIQQGSSQSIKMYSYIELQNVTLSRVTTKDWRTELFFQGVMAEPYGTESNFYYTELLNQWPKIYNIQADTDNNGSNNSGFKTQCIKDPGSIDFFLDFIDSSAEAGQFSVDNIGRRTLVLNKNEDVNCVFEPYVPDIILLNVNSADITNYDIKKLREECEARNQAYYQVSNDIYSNLALGGNLQSGYEVVKQLLHQYTSYNNNISIQTLPMFFLEPNTRITVDDQNSDIHGDYIINKMSFNIDTSSTLSINATKALEKI